VLYSQQLDSWGGTNLSRVTVVAVVAGLWPCLAFAAVGRTEPEERPNVLLVVADTLRADHLGCYGYSRDTSGRLDAFAKGAFVFRNAYAQTPCTTPSMWNIVTSKYQSAMPASDDDTTLAEYLKSKGYRTGAFLAQHQLDAAASNLRQGFDVYDQRSRRDRHGLSTRTAASVADAAIDWIGRDPSEPFFAWLVFYDPHDPYLPPEGFRGRYTGSERFSRDRRAEGLHGLNNEPVSDAERDFLIAAYDEEVRYFDHELGRLFDYLGRSGRDDDTLIVVTADHGEELGDHGNRWDHCQLLSEEEIRVPLVLKLPGQTHGVVLDDPAQHIDIYATLVDYLDGPHPPAFRDELEGVSLLPLLEGRPTAGTRYAAAFWHEQRALITNGHKYWVHGDEEIFVDVATGEAGVPQGLRERMKRRLDEIYREYFIENEHYAEILERLAALGYIHE